MTIRERIERLARTPVAALTAYDYPTARLLDESGIDLILVGDSLGMVFAGNPDTTSVTMEHMVYHTSVVRRGVRDALLVADLPYHSYDSARAAVDNARRLVDAGADAVKLEGGLAVIDQVRAIVAQEIPFLGHVGMLPQSILREGKYRKKGRSSGEAEALVADARALEDAGAFGIVLESIVPEVAAAITRAVGIPTIGIGAGSGCRGRIAVIHDLVGFFPWFVPPFAVPRADFASGLRHAAEAYRSEVKGLPAS
jgi:3-methyl-2-oxobutanoate hydroxymethyltransferase